LSIPKKAVFRKKTRQVMIGNVKVGGGAPVSVQSMCNTDTKDVPATISQIKRLEKAGCDIARLAVPDMDAATCLGKIKDSINLPLVADIHFDYRLALEAIERGVDALRINPGNIGDRVRVEQVVRAAKARKIPIRIGVNSGSLEKDLLNKHGGKPCAKALVESALRNVRIFEDLGFRDIKISIKSSDVLTTVEAYRLISKKVNYPLHLGVTEAGTRVRGAVKSAVAMGILLYEGIGNTIRVSLTDDPVEEVAVGFQILGALGIRRRGIDLISCPTCGRAEVDLIRIANEVEKRLGHIKEPMKVAVMGCVVNGPGEAKDADFGVACGKGVGLFFRKGKVVSKIAENEIVQAILAEAEQMAMEKDPEAQAHRRERKNV
jgi:(E)-4-hydroxy-3-methylbut-2-enyl-diphosphate synthase